MKAQATGDREASVDGNKQQATGNKAPPLAPLLLVVGCLFLRRSDQK